MIGTFFPEVVGEFNFLIYVVDNGAADIIGYEALFAPVTVCPPPGGHEDRFIVSGNLTVVDAQPFPTSKDQCKNGGWRNYPQFKNQGECIESVQHGPDP